MMAQKRGSVNYKNHLLIPFIKELLHNGEYGCWQAGAAAYLEVSKEDCVHDSSNVKKSDQEFVQWDEEAHGEYRGEG